MTRLERLERAHAGRLGYRLRRLGPSKPYSAKFAVWCRRQQTLIGMVCCRYFGGPQGGLHGYDAMIRGERHVCASTASLTKSVELMLAKVR